MIYKIVEVSTDKASGHTYVLAHFWRVSADQIAGKPPDRINDFLMQLRPTGERVITNTDGWFKRTDGVFVDPEVVTGDEAWERETVDRDLPTEIQANIEAYWARAEAKSYPADHSTSTIQRDDSDPHGVLARADVLSLKEAKVEKP